MSTVRSVWPHYLPTALNMRTIESWSPVHVCRWHVRNRKPPSCLTLSDIWVERIYRDVHFTFRIAKRITRPRLHDNSAPERYKAAPARTESADVNRNVTASTCCSSRRAAASKSSSSVPSAAFPWPSTCFGSVASILRTIGSGSWRNPPMVF